MKLSSAGQTDQSPQNLSKMLLKHYCTAGEVQHRTTNQRFDYEDCCDTLSLFGNNEFSIFRFEFITIGNGRLRCHDDGLILLGTIILK